MNGATSTCPSCRGRVSLPEMRPAQVHCQRCGTSFWLMPDGAVRTSMAKAAAPVMGIIEPAATAPRTQRRVPDPIMGAGDERKHNPLVLGGVIAGSMLFLMLTALLLIVCLKSSEKPDSGNVAENTDASEVTQPSPTASPLPPVDPPVKPLLVCWAKAGSSAAAPTAICKAGRKPVGRLKPPTAEKSAVDQERIDRAIAGGVDYLRKGGSYHGYVAGVKALAGLTLLSCGVLRDDPAVTAAVRRVRDAVDGLSNAAEPARKFPARRPLGAMADNHVKNTYELALCLLFLDRLGQPEDRARIRRIALRLIAGQGPLGGWGYTCLPLSAAEENELLRLLKNPPAAPQLVPAGPQPKKSAIAPGRKAQPKVNLERNMRTLPVFQFRPGGQWFSRQRFYEDNSLTQFAILALWAAQKHGIPAERSLAMAEARFRASQAPDGSWCYQFHDTNRCKYSMTCAGLLGLAAGRGTQRRTDEDAKKDTNDPQIDKALRFVSQEIGTDHVALWLKSKTGTYNDTASGWGGLYFLWSLERAAVVYDLRTIGGKDWYAWGAPIILDAQQADGSWQDVFAGIPDTCFALLFLKRTNVVQDLTRKIQFLTMSKEAGVRMREREPAQDLSVGRQRELSGSAVPGRVRGLLD